MHVLLKKHIYLKSLNIGKYKILSIFTKNLLLILLTVFFKTIPIIIQKIDNIYYINFIFKTEDFCNLELTEDIICNLYNTDDYISFCLSESFINTKKVSQNIYLYQDKLMTINFFDYENIANLY